MPRFTAIATAAALAMTASVATAALSFTETIPANLRASTNNPPSAPVLVHDATGSYESPLRAHHTGDADNAGEDPEEGHRFLALIRRSTTDYANGTESPMVYKMKLVAFQVTFKSKGGSATYDSTYIQRNDRYAVAPPQFIAHDAAEPSYFASAHTSYEATAVGPATATAQTLWQRLQRDFVIIYFRVGPTTQKTNTVLDIWAEDTGAVQCNTAQQSCPCPGVGASCNASTSIRFVIHNAAPGLASIVLALVTTLAAFVV